MRLIELIPGILLAFGLSACLVYLQRMLRRRFERSAVSDAWWWLSVPFGLSLCILDWNVQLGESTGLIVIPIVVTTVEYLYWAYVTARDVVFRQRQRGAFLPAMILMGLPQVWWTVTFLLRW